jgi:hypothetical protein
MAATNVQAFPGDVQITSNLAVSGSKFTYDNIGTTVFTGRSTAIASEIGYLDMSTSSASNNTHVKIFIKMGSGGSLSEAEYSFYIRPNAANFSLIYDYRNRNNTMTPVVYRTNANDLHAGGTSGVVRFGYSIAAAQNVVWRVEVIQRSSNVTFYPTNTGSAVVTTNLVHVTPAPFTRFDSNVAVGGNKLFVDTIGGTVGIGSTLIDITDNTLSGAGNGLYIHNPVENAHLLTLGTQRPWVFEQGLADASTELCLRSLNNGKHFNFQSVNKTDVMTIVATDGAGKVGIGTNDPAAKLDLVLGTSTGDDGPVLRLGTGGIEGSFTGGIAFSEGVTSESRTGLHMGIYYDGATNKMHFTDSNASSSLVASLEAADKLVTIERTTGHVGIGTTNPADELVVAGTIRVDNGSQYPLIMDPGHALVYNAQRYFPNISANSDNYLGRFSSNGSPAEFNITDTGSALGSGSLYNMAKMYGTTATNPPVVTGLNSSIFTSYGFYWQTTSTTTYDVWFRPTRAGYYTVRVRAQGYSLPTEPSSPTLVAVNYGSVVDTYGSPGLTINKSRRYNKNSQLEVSGNVVVKQHMTFCSGGDETSTINLIPNNVPTTCSYLSFVRSGYFQTNAVDTSAGSSGLLFATNSSNDIFTWGMYQHYVKPSAGFTTAVGIEIGRVDTIADESSTSYKDSSPTFTHLFNLQATGNFGAGTRDPLTRFHAYNSYANSGSAMIGEGPHHNNTNASEILDAMVSPSLIMPTPAPSNADDVVIAWKGSLASKYKVTIDGVPYFTGQHGGVPINYDLKSNVSNYTGLIVCPTDTGYKSYNHTTGLTHVGQRAIEINECLPYIKLSETAYDKSVFGVLSNAPNNSPCDEYGDLEVDDDPNKKFGNTLRDRVRINSLGEGAIWVTDLNGNLENGDYITSSNISGYGMKQDSEFLANYTVGKITMSCDFNPNTITVKQHKKVFKTNKYWIKYTSYEEVAYKVYEDTPDDQRIMDTLQEFLNTEIEEPPISLAEYNSLEPEVQAKYTPESRVRYRTRGVDRRKYEEPPPESMRSDFEVITVDEYVDDLDANGISILEDVPSGETELEYKIRYLDSVGAITDEAGASCKAAFVGCTYHCG